MKKYYYFKTYSAILLFIACLFACTKKNDTNSSPKKPNIVFILADDMGYGDLTCYNSASKIPTPNIDQLALQGIKFTDAHAPGAWCVPSRYGLITGRYPGKMEMKTGQQSIIEPSQETLGTLMKRNGYKTACIGKWHLGFDSVDWKNPKNIGLMKGGPVDKGFDYFFGMHASLDIPPYFYIENDQAVQAPTANIDDHGTPGATSSVSGAFFRAGAISPDFKHDEVLDKFLDKARNYLDNHQKNHQDDPFFLYFPLTAPHTPWLPKDEFVGASGAGEYGDFVMQVDDVVGQLITHLKQNNLLENTIIFFSSDNGPVWFNEDEQKFDHMSTGALRGIKSDMWEGGSRVPFIVSSPSQFAQGTQSSQMICFTDMMATLADIIDDHTINNADFHSHSFLPILQNPDDSKPIRDDLVIEKKVYRKGEWKFIDGSGQGGITLRYSPGREQIKTEQVAGELYNLKDDLSEQNNLYEQYPEKVSEMRTKLHEILNE